MPITPRFSKALFFMFAGATFLALWTLVLKFTGTSGLSLSEPNSFSRILLNELTGYAAAVFYWGIILYLTKDRNAFYAVIALKTILLGYILFSYDTGEMVRGPESPIYKLRFFVNALLYAVFGLIHFKHVKGLYLLLAWVILTGLSIGPFFQVKDSFVYSLLRMMDLERAFTWVIELGEGRERHIDLLQPFLVQLHLLATLIVFWFVYSLIKYGRSMDLSLRTIHLNPEINQAAFSLIYWPMRLTLMAAIFGLGRVLSRSIEEEISGMNLFVLVCSFIGIFAGASLYRNFITDYLVSKNKYPSWVFWLLNIPILNFFTWIYTFFIHTPPKPAFAYNIPEHTDHSLTLPAPEADSANLENDIMEEPPSMSNELPDPPPVPQRKHPLQLDFLDDGKNNMIKIILILFSIGMLIREYKDRNTGYMRPDSEQAEAPVTLALITLALTIWYLYDRRLFIPVYILQCLSILSIALFQMSALTTVVVASGLVNIVVYYALFHFDHLKLKYGDLEFK